MRCACGAAIPRERWEAGYHYCVRPECFRRYGKRQVIVGAHVNKSIPAIIAVVSKDGPIERDDLRREGFA